MTHSTALHDPCLRVWILQADSLRVYLTLLPAWSVTFLGDWENVLCNVRAGLLARGF